METQIDFVRWLSKKLIEVNVGFYLTIGLVMSLPFAFIPLGLPPFLARFIAFFIVSFLRAAYESVIVYETPVKKLSLYKMLLLTFVTASILSLVAHFLRPQIGFFAIPVSYLISMFVVGKLKAVLWPASQRTGFVALLPAKLKLVSRGRHGFLGILGGVTWFVCRTYGMDFFPYAFAAAFFVGMIFEEVYNIMKLYEEKVTTKSLIAMVIWSAVCSVAATAIVLLLMKQFGLVGQAATIASVILIKLVQPLGSRKFILGV